MPSARVLAFAAAMLSGALATSCLIASVTDFPEQAPTAPFFLTARANPPTTALVTIADVTTHTFESEVNAEDNGVPLQVLLVSDWKVPDQELVVGSAVLAPSSFDPPRGVGVPFTPGAFTTDGAKVAYGCHVFTLIATHGFARFQPTTPANIDDSSFLVWQVLLVDPMNPTAAPASCPETGSSP